jgi:hypothetical protein
MSDNITPAKSYRFLPLTIRIATVGRIATPLVLRGTPLPARRSDVFSTASDSQASIEIELFMGERPLTDGNVPMGRFVLQGIPPAASGAPKISVEFSVDTACVVKARAAISGSDIVAEGTFKSPIDLDAETISKVLGEAQKAQEADGVALRLAEGSIRAERLIGQAEEKLKAGPNKDISEAIAALGLALAENTPDAIREKSDVIESLLSKPLAPVDFSDIFSQFFGAGTPRSARSAGPPRSRPQKRTSSPNETLLTPSPNLQMLGKIFGGSTFTLDPQLCFVIMPFGEKLQPIYEDSIRPTIEASGLRCERADEVRGTTHITWDIWERINRARFLVADLTDLNANVFYELGLAHALSKEVVLITQSMEFVPFDLKALRCICYDMTRRGTERLEKQLAATIAALMKM